MEPATDRVLTDLYDFIYRDQNRFASYSAQLFDGRRSGVEITKQSKDTATTTGKGGVPGVAGLDYAKSKESQDGRRESIDPHDTAVVEVLEEVRVSGRLSEDILTAKANTLVRVEGDVFFVSSTAMGLYRDMLETTFKPMKKGPARENLEMAHKALAHLKLPSVCVLKTPFGVEVIGSVREEWMSEPPSVYEAMHGEKAIPGVVMIGIKEGDSFSYPGTNTPDTSAAFIGSNRLMAHAIRNMMFPNQFMHVTPLAIFRRLDPI